MMTGIEAAMVLTDKAVQYWQFLLEAEIFYLEASAIGDLTRFQYSQYGKRNQSTSGNSLNFSMFNIDLDIFRLLE